MEILKKPNPISNIVLLEEHKIGYIPVPKSGCSSIKLAIAEFLNLGIPKNRIHANLKMEKIKSKSDYPDFFIFSIVRNPIDRLFSAYKSKIAKKRNQIGPTLKNGAQKALADYYGNAFYGGMTFEQYIATVCKIKDLHSDEHFRSQHFILHDRNAKPLFDFVGKLENLQEDILYLSQHHNLPLKNVGHFGNKAKYISDNLQEVYNDKNLKDKIYSRFELDFTTFNY